MKQNKAHRKEFPHREDMPFELSNVSQKLEVRYVFLVSSGVIKIDFMGGTEVSVSSACRGLHMVVTNTIANHPLLSTVSSLPALHELKHHFDLCIFYIYQYFGRAEKRSKKLQLLSEIEGHPWGQLQHISNKSFNGHLTLRHLNPKVASQ
jgi:hypothetical protein